MSTRRPPHDPTPPSGTPAPQRPVRKIGAPPPEGPDRNFARWGLGIAGFFIFVGIGWTVMLLGQRPPDANSQEWPNTMGMVLSCEQDITTPEHRNEPHNRIIYRYDVDDRRYEGESTTLGTLHTFVCAEYPLGKAVRVYYAPWQPRTSTLTPEATEDVDLSGQLGGAMFCLIAGIALGVVQVAILFGPEWMRARRENLPS